MRHTSGHTRNRRSHHALKKTNLVVDKESGKLRMPHRLDESTGKYRGKLIVPERAKAVKADAKAKKAQKEGKAEKHEGHSHVAASDKTEKNSSGMFGRLKQSRAKARSGMGGDK